MNLFPYDKSWEIRMAILDLLDGRDEAKTFLTENIEDLSDDLKATQRCLLQWKENKPLEVGESGTLYRFLQYTAWKQGLEREFVKEGTLKSREICDDPSIIHWPLEKLLTLDNGTSQWASAAVLNGNINLVKNPPYKLQVTYDAVSSWHNFSSLNVDRIPRYDQTIKNQAKIFEGMLKKKKKFKPEQAEDYCFAEVFGFITSEEAEKRWPSLRGHETDRIKEMTKVHRAIDGKFELDSKDHRAVQAYAMYQAANGDKIRVNDPSVVNKSWPQFWHYLKKTTNSEPL